MSQIGEQAKSHKAEDNLIPANVWGHNIEVSFESLKSNLFEIKKQIVPCKSRIIGVTKYYSADAIQKGYEAGLRDFGESRAVDAIKKIESLPSDVRKNSTFHFIGHLQSNKVEKVVKYFEYIHSVDSLKLAKLISEAAEKLNQNVKIFLQVNNAGEVQKFGYDRQALEEDFPKIIALKSIEVVGLMNMAPLGAGKEQLKKVFGDLRRLRDYLAKKFGKELPELSMGMSDDYEIALQEGSTMIRIGRKIFK